MNRRAATAQAILVAMVEGVAGVLAFVFGVALGCVPGVGSGARRWFEDRPFAGVHLVMVWAQGGFEGWAWRLGVRLWGCVVWMVPVGLFWGWRLV